MLRLLSHPCIHDASGQRDAVEQIAADGQCGLLGGFPSQSGCVFFVALREFFAVAGCTFLGYFYQSACVFWAVLRKIFLSKSTVFVNFSEVPTFVLT